MITAMMMGTVYHLINQPIVRSLLWLLLLLLFIHYFVFRSLVKTVVYDTFPQMVLINPLDVVTLFYRSGIAIILLSFCHPFTFHPSISISNPFDYQLFL